MATIPLKEKLAIGDQARSSVGRQFLPPRSTQIELLRSTTCGTSKGKVFKLLTMGPRKVHPEGIFHRFTSTERNSLQNSMLSWFDVHQRNLPWRNITTEDPNKRAYAVWVSEIMLQQTQVATVISYYEKWMKKWPTLQDLAGATAEEVNSMWSGLGYYSRGRRLLEGAQKVVKELDGEMPKTAQDLQKFLPGVGRYTAGAVASIAFGEVTGLVDGNVMRVLTRLRMIGAHITQQSVIDEFWSIANEYVDAKRPGDFNQAIMELGATVCTPRNPSCNKCPVKSLCRAFSKAENDKGKKILNIAKSSKSSNADVTLPDIECLVPDCKLCLSSDEPWDSSLGVHNYPRKPKKAEARQEDYTVLVMQDKSNAKETQYLLCQRPKKGLLAGLWEFPMCLSQDSKKKVQSILSEDFQIDPTTVQDVQDCGLISHVFSHVRHNYHIYSMKTDEKKYFQEEKRQIQWVAEDEMEEIAMSTGMRKVFKVYKEHSQPKKNQCKRKSDSENSQQSKKSQMSISSYFKTTVK